jgi:hypothetical protein
MTTDNAPEGATELQDLQNARLRLREQFQRDNAGTGAGGEAWAQYDKDDAVYRRHIVALCEGNDELTVIAHAWNAANGFGITQADVDQFRARWGLLPAPDKADGEPEGDG